MAGNVAFVNREAKVMAQYALGLDANITGITFDGFYWWAVDSTKLYQLFQRNDGTFCVLQKITMVPSVLPDSTSMSCMDNDGVNLLIGYSGATGFPLTAFQDVAIVNKSGVYLGQYSPGLVAGATGAAWQDIAFTGAHVLAMRTSGLGVPNNWQIRLANPQGAVIQVNQRNPYNAFAFDGLNFPAASNTSAFTVLDWSRRVLYPSTALGITVSCAVCPNRVGVPSHDHRVESTYIAFGYN